MTYIGRFVAINYADGSGRPNIGTFSVGDKLLITSNYTSVDQCNNWIGFADIVSNSQYPTYYTIHTYLYYGDSTKHVEFEASQRSSTSTQVSLKLTSPYNTTFDIYKL